MVIPARVRLSRVLNHPPRNVAAPVLSGKNALLKANFVYALLPRARTRPLLYVAEPAMVDKFALMTTEHASAN